MKKKFGCLALSAMLFALCASAQAQQPKKAPAVGFVARSPSSAVTKSNIDTFRQGLRDLGYVEEKNIVIKYWYTEGREDRLSDLAAELVGSKVDIIVTGSTPVVGAAMQLTGTIPIVMAGTGDPVATGLIRSLARPEGSVTGLSAFGPELTTKQLELLKEAFPQVSRVLFLFNGTNSSTVVALKELEVAASALGVQLQASDVRVAKDIEPAFSAATRQRANALLVLREALYQTNATQIVSLAAQRKLPAIYPTRRYVDVGGLMAYGIIESDLYRRAAVYVDKILKGAKPAELPVEQPTKFEFIVNLKTAKQMGLTIRPNVLARADRVIR